MGEGMNEKLLSQYGDFLKRLAKEQRLVLRHELLAQGLGLWNQMTYAEQKEATYRWGPF